MKKQTKSKSTTSRIFKSNPIQSPDTSKDTASKSTGSVQVASRVEEFDSDKISGEEFKKEIKEKGFR